MDNQELIDRKVKIMELREKKREWRSGYAPIEHLKEIRKWRGMSQFDLAKKADITKETISRIENGKRLPRLSLARKFGGILGVHFY